MKILFVDSTLRENSRTLFLAKKYLEKLDGQINRLILADSKVKPLNKQSLAKYGQDVENKDYSDEMYDYAKEFSNSDMVVIAAPFYNFSIPALLHDYLEMVCSQGVTFDLDSNGDYYSLCKIKILIKSLNNGLFGCLVSLVSVFIGVLLGVSSLFISCLALT